MLRGARPYAQRLVDAARKFGDGPYRLYRRVNWSYRYDDEFYRAEAASFLEAPDDYLRGAAARPAVLSDIFSRKLSNRQLAVSLMKVLAHWLFRVLGLWVNPAIRRRKIAIYRKAYVDDIEIAFDPAEPGVVRAVYPFPLGAPRQLRYLRQLLRKGHFFKLDGNAYSLPDLLRLLRRRDVASLIRLEARAQFRQAKAILGLGVHTVQLSDEFDLGSLEIARYLARHPVRVVNSAHGAGMYLPFHCYREFDVITERQKQFYFPIRPCTYRMRRLSDLAGARQERAAGGGVNVVILGQAAEGEDFIAENETRLIEIVSNGFSGRDGVRLFYKPHPNRANPLPSPGLQLLRDLATVNGQAGTLFMSFFSTCQIDPNFKGTKILIGTDIIRPEIFFDDSETIVPIDRLVRFIDDFARARLV